MDVNGVAVYKNEFNSALYENPYSPEDVSAVERLTLYSSIYSPLNEVSLAGVTKCHPLAVRRPEHLSPTSVDGLRDDTIALVLTGRVVEFFVDVDYYKYDRQSMVETSDVDPPVYQRTLASLEPLGFHCLLPLIGSRATPLPDITYRATEKDTLLLVLPGEVLRKIRRVSCYPPAYQRKFDDLAPFCFIPRPLRMWVYVSGVFHQSQSVTFDGRWGVQTDGILLHHDTVKVGEQNRRKQHEQQQQQQHPHKFEEKEEDIVRLSEQRVDNIAEHRALADFQISLPPLYMREGLTQKRNPDIEPLQQQQSTELSSDIKRMDSPVAVFGVEEDEFVPPHQTTVTTGTERFLRLQLGPGAMVGVEPLRYDAVAQHVNAEDDVQRKESLRGLFYEAGRLAGINQRDVARISQQVHERGLVFHGSSVVASISDGMLTMRQPSFDAIRTQNVPNSRFASVLLFPRCVLTQCQFYSERQPRNSREEQPPSIYTYLRAVIQQRTSFFLMHSLASYLAVRQQFLPTKRQPFDALTMRQLFSFVESKRSLPKTKVNNLVLPRRVQTPLKAPDFGDAVAIMPQQRATEPHPYSRTQDIVASAAGARWVPLLSFAAAEAQSRPGVVDRRKSVVGMWLPIEVGISECSAVEQQSLSRMLRNSHFTSSHAVPTGRAQFSDEKPVSGPKLREISSSKHKLSSGTATRVSSVIHNLVHCQRAVQALKQIQISVAAATPVVSMTPEPSTASTVKPKPSPNVMILNSLSPLESCPRSPPSTLKTVSLLETLDEDRPYTASAYNSPAPRVLSMSNIRPNVISICSPAGSFSISTDDSEMSPLHSNVVAPRWMLPLDLTMMSPQLPIEEVDTPELEPKSSSIKSNSLPGTPLFKATSSSNSEAHLSSSLLLDQPASQGSTELLPRRTSIGNSNKSSNLGSSLSSSNSSNGVSNINNSNVSNNNFNGISTSKVNLPLPPLPTTTAYFQNFPMPTPPTTTNLLTKQPSLRRNRSTLAPTDSFILQPMAPLVRSPSVELGTLKQLASSLTVSSVVRMDYSSQEHSSFQRKEIEEVYLRHTSTESPTIARLPSTSKMSTVYSKSGVASASKQGWSGIPIANKTKTNHNTVAANVKILNGERDASRANRYLERSSMKR